MKKLCTSGSKACPTAGVGIFRKKKEVHVYIIWELISIKSI